MSDIIQVEDQFYILASSSLADAQNSVLKHGDTFAVFDRHGDVRPLGFEDHGIYHEGTRFLSRHTLKFQKRTPLLLSSTVKEDNDLLAVDLTNPDFSQNGSSVHRGSIYIGRSIFLWDACCYERVMISNYGLAPVAFNLALEFEADYADIFEVRGIQRKQRGSLEEPVAEAGRLTLGYRGLDGRTRRTRIELDPPPASIDAGSAGYDLSLKPNQTAVISLRFICETDGHAPPVEAHDVAFQRVKKAYQKRRDGICEITTSNEQFNEWINRSRSDLNMLITETAQGPYPYAGIPWFSTIFGRDGLITAIQTLWVNPDIARGVLGYLAARQASEVIPERDAEPGKILHEERGGEMASLGEIPFGCYYGTIDATALFILLAGLYYERTADRPFLEKMWPHVERALEWIRVYGDQDQDGFVEYKRRSDGGLSHQGWKDSEDPVFHQDGRLAEAPIALCEVQGYVYEAKLKASQMAFVLGMRKQAVRLRREAEALKEKFARAFWCEDINMYAIALDGAKNPCRIRSSNAGQCLFTGIAREEHAAVMAEQLLGKAFSSGWGIRTLAATEPRFNPMSYHNGSIWPHDNSLIAFGLARYGYREHAMKIMSALFEASAFVGQYRLPELYCGFERRAGEGPTLYPVACDPQAWASASVFLLLQACLGLSIHADQKRIAFDNTAMPPFLSTVTIHNLRVGEASLDIHIQRHAGDVGINLIRRTGSIDVVITK